MNAPIAAKRFYTAARARAVDGGFGVALDARALKTPSGAAFIVPTQALAEACAVEWAAQGEHIIPASMPLTQLAFAAIDHPAPRRDEVIAHIAKYAETDLCCHRAHSPVGLAARQAEVWDPLVAAGAERYGVRLPIVAGIVPAAMDAASMAQARAIASALDAFQLTALSQGASLAGSILIALALLDGRLDGAGAFAAATIDEAWSMAHWGEDHEMRARLDRLRGEFDAVARFMVALR